MLPKSCEAPGPRTGVSLGASGPRNVPENGDVQESVHGVSLGPRALRAPECPKSLPRVFPECPGQSFHTPGTLSGHCLGTLEPRGQRAWGHPVGHPVFAGTLSWTLFGTLGPEGLKEPPVGGPGASQPKHFKGLASGGRFAEVAHSSLSLVRLSRRTVHSTTLPKPPKCSASGSSLGH